MITMAENQKSEIRNQKFRSLLSAAAFPGRRALYIYEIARVLRISRWQVLDLVHEGELDAIDIASPKNETDRKFFRVSVCSYDAYILRGGKRS